MTAEAVGPRPFKELSETGLLWLINVSVFHPRGYALGLHPGPTGEYIGWSLLGDGTESWYMSEPTDEQHAAGARTHDELFALAKAMMP